MIGRRTAERMGVAMLCLAALGTASGGCGFILGIKDLSDTGLDGGVNGGGDQGGSGCTMCEDGCKLLDTDTQNCGVCGHDCLGTKCVSGMCAPILTKVSQTRACGIVVDAKRAYTATSDSIVSVALDGADVNPQTVTSGISGDVCNIAVDANSVYWVSRQGKIVGKASLPTGYADPIYTGLSPLDIAVDASGIYWKDGAFGYVMQAGLDGSNPHIVPDKDEGSEFFPGIALDSTSVYWTSAHGNVWKVGKSGGSATSIATAQESPRGIVVDDSFVYWVNNAGNGGVMKASVDGQFMITLAMKRATSIALDVDYVYVAGADDEVLAAIPLNGGSPVPLAHYDTSSSGIAVDTTYVYWTTEDGHLAKVPKLH